MCSGCVFLLLVVVACRCTNRYSIDRWAEHAVLFGRCERVLLLVDHVRSSMGMGSTSIEERRDYTDHYLYHERHAGRHD